MVKIQRTRRRRTGPSRTSLLIVLGVPTVLVTVILALIYAPKGPVIYQLPSNIAFKAQDWMTYVPREASLVKFYNYTNILSSPAGAKAILNNTVIRVHENNFTLAATDLDYGFTVYFGESATVDVARPSAQVYRLFYSTMNGTVPGRTLLGAEYFMIAGKSPTTKADVGFSGGYVFYTQGGQTTLRLLEKVLKTHAGDSPNFFSSGERRTEYYLITNPQNQVMEFSILTNTTLGGSHEWVSAVYDAKSSISVLNYYAFDSPQQAVTTYPALQDRVLSHLADSFIIGNFVAQAKTFDWDHVTTALASI